MQQRALETRSRILKVAELEFAEKGSYGVRIDEIAAKAKVNKALIYKYFGSKDNLYKTIFSIVYDRFSVLERQLFIDGNENFREKLKKFIEMDFLFLKDNPTYVRMLMWENLNNARYYNEKKLGSTKSPILEGLEKILQEAKETSEISKDIDAKQILLTVYGCGFNYFSNAETMKSFIGKDLLDDDVLRERIDFVTKMIFSYVFGDKDV